MSLSPGGSIPRDMREWDRWAASQVALPSHDIQQWTPTYTGFSVNPVGDFSFINLGTFALVWGGATGTSSATTFTVTNVPSIIRTSVLREAPTFAFDNGAFVHATARMLGSLITFCVDQVVGAQVRPFDTGWTSSGIKGLSGWFMYPLV